jgi:hypothetical protein
MSLLVIDLGDIAIKISWFLANLPLFTLPHLFPSIHFPNKKQASKIAVLFITFLATQLFVLSNWKN